MIFTLFQRLAAVGCIVVVYFTFNQMVFVAAQEYKSINNNPSVERRNDVSFLRGKYNIAQFNRHNRTFRYSAAMHFLHGKQHDSLQLNPLTVISIGGGAGIGERSPRFPIRIGIQRSMTIF